MLLLGLSNVFPHICLTTLWTNILVYDITGYKGRYTIFLIEKKNGYREVVNKNKFHKKLRIKLGNTFLNILADRQVGQRTQKLYSDEKPLFFVNKKPTAGEGENIWFSLWCLEFSKTSTGYLFREKYFLKYFNCDQKVCQVELIL